MFVWRFFAACLLRTRKTKVNNCETNFFERRSQMKKVTVKLAVLVMILATCISAYADVYVRGYYRSNGTYVSPHYRSNPDGNFYNNWSTYPNVNPYTGSIGTRRTPSYSAPTHYFQSHSYPSLNYNSRVRSSYTPYSSYGSSLGSSLSSSHGYGW